MIKKICGVLVFTLLVLTANAQIVERERPQKWEQLVHGGRFMDRFLPMPKIGQPTADTWGAPNVVPRYVDNGMEDTEWSYWGGNALKGEDGKFHLFVCRWKENSEKGHAEWPNSIVVHAVSDYSFGPYKYVQTVGKGHNPEIFQLSDGRFVVYVIHGYYIADSINGPWTYSNFKFDPRDRPIIEGLSNLSFARRKDGSMLMVCRGGGIWFSQTGVSPYHQVTDQRVYPPVDGHFEDPVVWRTHIQYHMIVNDWYGRIAYYLRSKDGVNWKIDPGEAYMPGIARYEDGTEEDWFKYERIKVFQDELGRATQAHFAVIDVLKKEDKGSDNHSSKHIVIPLTVGRQIELLNKKPVTATTKEIKVLVKAEDGFDPHTDIDLTTLRFGAPEVVNYGGGVEVLKTKKSGNDLIITFRAEGSGFKADNFTGKMLGKNSDGKLLFGYCRLPWVSYGEAILSAKLPVAKEEEKPGQLSVEIQNFGEKPSQKASVKVLFSQDDKVIAETTGSLDVLAPFEKNTVDLATTRGLNPGQKYRVKIIVTEGEKTHKTLTGELVF